MTAVIDNIDAESVAAAAQARHDAVPVPSEHGAAPARPENIVTAGLVSRMVEEIGSPGDVRNGIEADHKAIEEAQARIEAGEARLLDWMVVARATLTDESMTAKRFGSLTGNGPQILGRLRYSLTLHDAYGAAGLPLTPSECLSQLFAKNAADIEPICVEVRAGLDPLDVKGHRARGKRVPGNYVPGSHYVEEEAAFTAEVSHDETPDIETGNGGDESSEVFTMPPLDDWIRIVESMGAHADKIAAGRRVDMIAAAETLVAALVALDA